MVGNVENIIPLSPIQEALLFHTLYNQQGDVYIEQMNCTLQGNLNPLRFQQAWRQVIQQTPALRTAFIWQELDKPMQVVCRQFELPFTEYDWRDKTEVDAAQRFNHLLIADRQQGFDLSAPPLLRFTLVYMPNHSYKFILSHHHLILDGWSLSLVINEMLRQYDATINGRIIHPTPLFPFSDYIHWLQQQTKQDAQTYWQNQLAGFMMPTPLGAQANDKTTAITQYDIQHRQLSVSLTKQMQAFVRQHHLTLNSLTMGAWAILLGRYSGETDIVLGTTVSGRPPTLPQANAIIGCLINTLPMRITLPLQTDVLTWLQSLQIQLAEMREYEYSSLADIQRWSDVPATQPLFQTNFVFENYPETTVSQSDFQITELDLFGRANFPISIIVISNEAFVLGAGYDSQRFTTDTIGQLLANLEAIIQAILIHPAHTLSQHQFSLAQLPTQLIAPQTTYQLETLSNLTPNQLLIWTGQRLHPDKPFYNLCPIGAIYGPLDVSLFRQALATLIRSVDSLHTIIEEIDGIPQQRFVPDLQYHMPFIDLSNEPDPEAAFRQWLDVHRSYQFQLDKCLLEVTLLKLAPEKFMCCFHQHHIITDGISSIIITRHMSEFYRLARDGRLPHHVPLPSFHEYMDKERTFRQSKRYAKAKAYWQVQLDNPAPALNFYGKTVPRTRTGRVERITYDLGVIRTTQLKQLAQQEEINAGNIDITLYNIFSAILFTFLHHISGNNDIAVGGTFHNRYGKLKEVIGLLMHVFPTRITIEESDNFLTIIKKIAYETRQVLRHSRYPIPNRENNRAYEVTINYHTAITANDDFAGYPLDLEAIHSGYSDDNLGVRVVDFGSSGSLHLEFDISCDLFQSEQYDTIMQHFVQIVDAFINDYMQPIAQVNLLTSDERHLLLHQFNQTTVSLPPQQPISQLFEAQVKQTPQKTAVVYQSQSVTYAQLNSQANQLAHQLRKQGVQPESLVAIYAPRSDHFLTCILAIFKAGGAYLPLDTTHPPARLRQILQQSGCHTILVTADLAEQLQQTLANMPSAKRPLPTLIEEQYHHPAPTTNLPSTATPNNLAYVIYTSGSTGTPKGAMVEQKGMLNHLHAKIHDLNLTADDHIAQTASPCFDISVWQFLAPLLRGATVHILEDAVAHNPIRLHQQLQQQKITILEIVPPFMRLLLDTTTAPLPHLRWLITTGEALPPDLARDWHQHYPHIPLLNAYGPTECSDDVTHYTLNQTPSSHVINMPIGKPIANMNLYILDKHLNLVPQGVIGELYIDGIGVGRGYRNDPQRTSPAFIPNLFGDAGTRLYKTGDLTRHHANGNIEFLGRSDFQVKIRGFRIELGEIEVALHSDDDITEAVVLTVEDEQGQTHLVAYYTTTSNTQLNTNTIRTTLTHKLPDYMIPTYFTFLEALPLTSNGKIDRRTLATIKPTALQNGRKFAPPRDALETELIRIWEELLQIRPIGIHDNFFDLGGHSLLAIPLMVRIQKIRRGELPLSTLFQNATVAQLANVIREQQQQQWSSLIHIQTGNKTAKPFFCVNPTGGDGLGYHALAHQLPTAQPFYALQAPGLYDSQQLHTRVPDLAAYFLQHIQTVQLEGPYYLGGHSYGGLVAFEMARQLQLQGQQVALLALFDSVAPVLGNRTKDFMVDFDDEIYWLINAAQLFSRFLNKESTLSAAALRDLPPSERFAYFLQHSQQQGIIPENADLSFIQGLIRINKAANRATINYVAEVQPYNGDAVLFRAQEVAAEDFRAQARPLKGDPALGWQPLVNGQLHLETVPGNHISMLTQPHVALLAQKLTAYLPFV